MQDPPDNWPAKRHRAAEDVTQTEDLLDHHATQPSLYPEIHFEQIPGGDSTSSDICTHYRQHVTNTHATPSSSTALSYYRPRTAQYATDASGFNDRPSLSHQNRNSQVMMEVGTASSAMNTVNAAVHSTGHSHIVTPLGREPQSERSQDHQHHTFNALAPAAASMTTPHQHKPNAAYPYSSQARRATLQEYQSSQQASSSTTTTGNATAAAYQAVASWQTTVQDDPQTRAAVPVEWTHAYTQYYYQAHAYAHAQAHAHAQYQAYLAHCAASSNPSAPSNVTPRARAPSTSSDLALPQNSNRQNAP